MAQVRQQDEAYTSAMMACYAEYGLEGTETIGGNVVFLFETDDGSEPEIPAGVQQLMDVAAEDCNVRVPAPDHRGEASLDDAAYQRLVDLRECILAQGYDVPEPPSAEAWKDSSLESVWNPYEAMFGGPSGQQIPQDELRSLMVACPQGGPTYYAEVPDYGN